MSISICFFEYQEVFFTDFRSSVPLHMIIGHIIFLYTVTFIVNNVINIALVFVIIYCINLIPVGNMGKDMRRYCDGSRIMQVYDLRTKCEEAISKSVNMKEMVHALISCGYPVWYTDSAWLTLLRQFPTDRKVPRLYCTEKPVD